MKVYSVLAYDRTQTAYATKGEAMKAAREALAQEDVDVVRVEEIGAHADHQGVNCTAD
jgi:hypothetical protein